MLSVAEIEWACSNDGTILTGDDLSQWHLVHHKYHMDRPGIEPGPARWEVRHWPREPQYGPIKAVVFIYPSLSMCGKSEKMKYEFERMRKESVMTSQGLLPASTNICDVTSCCPSDKHNVCRQACCSLGLIGASGRVTGIRHCAFPSCPASPLLCTVLFSTQVSKSVSFWRRDYFETQVGPHRTASMSVS